MKKSKSKPAAMTRTQILMPPRMLSWLRQEAKRRQITVSELMRAMISARMEA